MKRTIKILSGIDLVSFVVDDYMFVAGPEGGGNPEGTSVWVEEGDSASLERLHSRASSVRSASAAGGCLHPPCPRVRFVPKDIFHLVPVM